MRLFDAPTTLLHVVAILLSSSSPVAAGPYSKVNDIAQQQVEKLLQDDLSLQNSTLNRRGDSGCASGSFACGYYGQICCVSSSQTCATNAQDQAYCADVAGGSSVTSAATAGSGTWQTYTSVWTTTGAITMTSIWSSLVPATATGAASGNCVPNYANDESACGPICCASGQYCADSTAGLCKPAGAGGYTTTGITNSPPTRATTSNGVVITMTMTPTTTLPYGTPIATGQNATIVAEHHSSGLSGGAIAGIVIGTLAGIVLLILICLCCCLKAGFDGILAILGLGKKKKRRVVEEEYYGRHSRYGSAAGSNRRWYGSGAGGRPGRPPPPEKKNRFGNIGALGLGLGGLAIALGLKRRHDRKQEEKSDISSSYDYSYYSYDSRSSDDRTRRSGPSRR